MNNIKTLKLIVGVLTITLIALATCFAFYYLKQAPENEPLIPPSTNTPSSSAQTEANTLHTSSEATLIATSSIAGTDSFLELLSPRGEEFLCRGENQNISWRAATGFHTISISIISESANGSTTYPLGSFPSSYNETGVKNGEGTFVWKAGYTESGIELPLDKTYQIIMNGCYSSPNGNNCRTLPTKSTPFSFLDCRG